MASVFHGHTTTKAVAQHMAIDPGAVSRLVDRLVAKDLIRREPDPGSRRTVLLVLTDEGRALVPVLAASPARTTPTSSARSKSQRDQLESWIRRLIGEPHPAPPHDTAEESS